MKSINHQQQQEDPLQAQLKTLEMEWNSIKQSISRSDRRNPSTTTTTATTTAAVVDDDNNRLFHQLHENSPKELMSLLQHENSPPLEHQIDGAFHTDRPPIETIEAIDDRSVDFGYGRLKGRRLFEEEDSEMDSNSNSGDFEGLEVAEERVVSREFSDKESENDDGNCDWISRGGGCVSSPVAAVVVERGGRGGGRRWMIRMTWIGVVVMMFAFGIVAFKCKGEEDEQFLVPT
ncbi:hypothetical protein OSB04_004877 [Centaurea solstitialis]|uniref:Uncharacterized protein n=1 Tax=Centaurea solstitialis TaxID=347529 RepID=A0AA38WFV6_9ASTR|nr:hypothetical protein OSB04_004877 [Centaurea solstitialis]